MEVETPEPLAPEPLLPAVTAPLVAPVLELVWWPGRALAT